VKDDKGFSDYIPEVVKQYCCSADYYKQFFNVTEEDVKKRIKLAIKPIGGDKHFYKEIDKNPDLYGPFWILVTWSFTLIFGIALNSLFQNSFRGISEGILQKE